MNYNANINWQPGMEITAKALRLLDESVDIRQKMALKLALGLGARGIVPNTEFSCNPAFVGRMIEINSMKMTALLPSGDVIHIDEDVSVEIDKASIEAIINDNEIAVHKVYLTVSIADETKEYTVEDVPFYRPAYTFHFCSEKEASESCSMPIVRMLVESGSLSIDNTFVLPTLIAGDMPRMKEFVESLTEKLIIITKHQNLEASNLRVFTIESLSYLRAYKLQEKTTDALKQTSDAVNLISEFLDEYLETHKLSAERPQMPSIPQYSLVNIDTFIDSVLAFFDALIATLDLCIVEDHSIDYDALKEQLKTEIMELMRPEMEEKLQLQRQQIHDQLTEEMDPAIHQIVDDTLAQLREQLRGELREDLYQPLYDALYDALKGSVFVKTVDAVDDFMPLI